MGGSNATINATGSVTRTLTNVTRGSKSYNGEKAEIFTDCHTEAGFILSMQHPDIFAMMEGPVRTTEETDDVVLTRELSLLDSCSHPGCWTPMEGPLNNAAFDRADQDLYTILYLVTDNAEALLVAIHAYNGCGNCGNEQKRDEGTGGKLYQSHR